MRKFIYELGAVLTVAFLIIPVCFLAAVIAIYEAAKLFSCQIFELFETWYNER